MIEEAYLKLSHEEKRLMARFAGRMISDVPKAIIPLYRVMEQSYLSENGKSYKTNEDAFFVALSIRCIFEKVEGVVISPEDFIKRGRESNKLGSLEGYDRRIAAVMESTELEYFSLKLAKLLNYTSELIGNCIPDCEKIYTDIIFINQESKSVQRRWASKIYS